MSKLQRKPLQEIDSNPSPFVATTTTTTHSITTASTPTNTSIQSTSSFGSRDSFFNHQGKATAADRNTNISSVSLNPNKKVSSSSGNKENGGRSLENIQKFSQLMMNNVGNANDGKENHSNRRKSISTLLNKNRQSNNAKSSLFGRRKSLAVLHQPSTSKSSTGLLRMMNNTNGENYEEDATDTLELNFFLQQEKEKLEKEQKENERQKKRESQYDLLNHKDDDELVLKPIMPSNSEDLEDDEDTQELKAVSEYNRPLPSVKNKLLQKQQQKKKKNNPNSSRDSVSSDSMRDLFQDIMSSSSGSTSMVSGVDAGKGDLNNTTTGTFDSAFISTKEGAEIPVTGTREDGGSKNKKERVSASSNSIKELFQGTSSASGGEDSTGNTSSLTFSSSNNNNNKASSSSLSSEKSDSAASSLFDIDGLLNDSSDNSGNNDDANANKNSDSSSLSVDVTATTGDLITTTSTADDNNEEVEKSKNDNDNENENNTLNTMDLMTKTVNTSSQSFISNLSYSTLLSSPSSKISDEQRQSSTSNSKKDDIEEHVQTEQQEQVEQDDNISTTSSTSSGLSFLDNITTDSSILSNKKTTMTTNNNDNDNDTSSMKDLSHSEQRKKKRNEKKKSTLVGLPPKSPSSFNNLSQQTNDDDDDTTASLSFLDRIMSASSPPTSAPPSPSTPSKSSSNSNTPQGRKKKRSNNYGNKPILNDSPSRNTRSTKKKKSEAEQQQQQQQGPSSPSPSVSSINTPNNKQQQVDKKKRPLQIYQDSPSRNTRSSTKKKKKKLTFQEQHGVVSAETFSLGSSTSISLTNDSSSGTSSQSLQEFQELETSILSQTNMEMEDINIMSHQKENEVLPTTPSSKGSNKSTKDRILTPGVALLSNKDKDKEQEEEQENENPFAQMLYHGGMKDTSKNENEDTYNIPMMSSNKGASNSSTANKKPLKSILNSNRKKNRNLNSSSVGFIMSSPSSEGASPSTTQQKKKKGVSFGSPEAAEYYHDSFPSERFTPMPRKTAKSMFIIPEIELSNEEEEEETDSSRNIESEASMSTRSTRSSRSRSSSTRNSSRSSSSFTSSTSGSSNAGSTPYNNSSDKRRKSIHHNGEEEDKTVELELNVNDLLFGNDNEFSNSSFEQDDGGYKNNNNKNTQYRAVDDNETAELEGDIFDLLNSNNDDGDKDNGKQDDDDDDDCMSLLSSSSSPDNNNNTSSDNGDGVFSPNESMYCMVDRESFAALMSNSGGTTAHRDHNNNDDEDITDTSNICKPSIIPQKRKLDFSHCNNKPEENNVNDLKNNLNDDDDDQSSDMELSTMDDGETCQIEENVNDLFKQVLEEDSADDKQKFNSSFSSSSRKNLHSPTNFNSSSSDKIEQGKEDNTETVALEGDIMSLLNNKVEQGKEDNTETVALEGDIMSLLNNKIEQGKIDNTETVALEGDIMSLLNNSHIINGNNIQSHNNNTNNNPLSPTGDNENRSMTAADSSSPFSLTSFSSTSVSEKKKQSNVNNSSSRYRRISLATPAKRRLSRSFDSMIMKENNSYDDEESYSSNRDVIGMDTAATSSSSSPTMNKKKNDRPTKVTLTFDEIASASEVWSSLDTTTTSSSTSASSDSTTTKEDLFLRCCLESNENYNYLLSQKVNEFLSEACEEVENKTQNSVENVASTSFSELLLGGASSTEESGNLEAMIDLQEVIRRQNNSNHNNENDTNASEELSAESIHTENCKEQLKTLAKVVSEFATSEWDMWISQVSEALIGSIDELETEIDHECGTIQNFTDKANQCHEEQLSKVKDKKVAQARRKSMTRRKSAIEIIEKEIESLESEICEMESSINNKQPKIDCLSALIANTNEINTLEEEKERRYQIADDARWAFVAIDGVTNYKLKEVTDDTIEIDFIGETPQTCIFCKFTLSDDTNPSLPPVVCKLMPKNDLDGDDNNKHQTSKKNKKHYSTAKSAVAQFATFRIKKLCQELSGNLESTKNIEETVHKVSLNIIRIEIIMREIYKLLSKYDALLEEKEEDYSLLTVMFREKTLSASFEIRDGYPFIPMDMSLSMLKENSICLDGLIRHLEKSVRPGYGYLSKACDVVSTFLGD